MVGGAAFAGSLKSVYIPLKLPDGSAPDDLCFICTLRDSEPDTIGTPGFAYLRKEDAHHIYVQCANLKKSWNVGDTLFVVVCYKCGLYEHSIVLNRAGEQYSEPFILE